MVEMRQGLICFENSADAKQTVVCVGDLILTKTRENINLLKLKLLDRKDREASNPNTSQANLSANLIQLKKNETNFVTANGDSEESPLRIHEEEKSPVAEEDNDNLSYEYTQKTNILLLSLTDFCPYFCSTEDLNGKQFRDVRKREIMSPFNMHFNVTKMIELVNRSDARQANDLVFLKFKKTEISLDWTLLKLSFQDIKLLKQIGDFNLKLIKERLEAEEKKQAVHGTDEENMSESSYGSSEDSEECETIL